MSIFDASVDAEKKDEAAEEGQRRLQQQLQAALPDLRDMPNPRDFGAFLLRDSHGNIPCASEGVQKMQESNGPHKLFVEATYGGNVSNVIAEKYGSSARAMRSWLYFLITSVATLFSVRLPKVSSTPRIAVCYPQDHQLKGAALRGRAFTADLVAKTYIAAVLYAAIEEDDMQAAKSRVEESVPQGVEWNLTSLWAVPVCALTGKKLEFGCHDSEGQVTWTGVELDIDTVAGRGTAVIAVVQMYRLWRKWSTLPDYKEYESAFDTPDRR